MLLLLELFVDVGRVTVVIGLVVVVIEDGIHLEVFVLY